MWLCLPSGRSGEAALVPGESTGVVRGVYRADALVLWFAVVHGAEPYELQ